ncbi:hypothetical protein GCM10009735_46940 [Actinomadura chokoriensis]
MRVAAAVTRVRTDQRDGDSAPPTLRTPALLPLRLARGVSGAAIGPPHARVPAPGGGADKVLPGHDSPKPHRGTDAAAGPAGGCSRSSLRNPPIIRR